MGFMNRLTIILSMLIFSYMSAATTQMSSLTQFIVGLAFWIAFFWWFDSTFFTVEQIAIMIEELAKDKKDDN